MDTKNKQHIGGIKKMTYNAQNAREVNTGVDPGMVCNAKIVEIQKGKVIDFIKPTSVENWKGDVQGLAIEVTFETQINKTSYKIKKMFTYSVGSDGVTEYRPRSNLGKYKKRYGKLPELNDTVALMANSEGFLELVFK